MYRETVSLNLKIEYPAYFLLQKKYQTSILQFAKTVWDLAQRNKAVNRYLQQIALQTSKDTAS